MHPQQQVIEKSEYYVGWHIRKRMGCHAFLLYELNIRTYIHCIQTGSGKSQCSTGEQPAPES